MKVKTLHKEEFEETCKRLEICFSDYNPDCIVGIAEGGLIVSQYIFPELPHYSVVCRRPSTGTKEKNEALMKIVRRMPEWIRNTLRIMEAKLLSSGKIHDSLNRKVIFNFDPAEIKGSRILLIDDAVDSGVTLKMVMEELAKVFPDKTILTGTITVTQNFPVIMPTKSVFQNILIRFPWSKDYRAKK